MDSEESVESTRTVCHVCGGVGYTSRPTVAARGEELWYDWSPRRCTVCDGGWLAGFVPPM
jgi:hypothetical protein